MLIAISLMAILAVTIVSTSADAADEYDPATDPSLEINKSVASFDKEGTTLMPIGEAISQCNEGDIIYLHDDFNWVIDIPSGKSVVLDLNGFDVCPPDGTVPFFNSGTLTLLNTGDGESLIGDNSTGDAISNTGTLHIEPTNTIRITGTICNADYNDGSTDFVRTAISGDVVVQGNGSSPALKSDKDGSSFIIESGTFGHNGNAPLITAVEGTLYLNGGAFTAADGQPILRYNNNDIGNDLNIVIGDTTSGPTMSGKSSAGTPLFEDVFFGTNIDVSYTVITMNSGTVTQNGTGEIFKCGVNLAGGQIVREASSTVPMVDCDSSLNVAIPISGTSTSPLVRCTGEFYFAENGSVEQKGTGYALECSVLNISQGTITAKSDAVLSHGNLHINGDSTSPTVTSDNGSYFLTNDGTIQGGKYSFGGNSLVRLNNEINSDTDICFGKTITVNKMDITEVEGPLVSSDDGTYMSYSYAVTGNGATSVTDVFIHSMGDWRCIETRETENTVFDAVYETAENENGETFLFNNINTPSVVFPNKQELMSLTLMKDTSSISLDYGIIALDLGGFNIGTIEVNEPAELAITGSGTVGTSDGRFATGDGYLTIVGGTYLGTPDEYIYLAVAGGQFEQIPPDAFLPEGYTFVLEDGMWTPVRTNVIEVDGTAYDTLSDAMAAIKNGSQVKLLLDNPGTLTLYNINVSLDLNGFALGITGDVGLQISPGANVTVSDNSGKEPTTNIIVENGGSLTILGGTYGLVISSNNDPNAKNVLTVKGGHFVGENLGGITAAMIIGDPIGATTVRITGGTFDGDINSWDVIPNDNRTPKVYIAGGTFMGDLVGMMDDPGAIYIDPSDAGFMVSGGTFDNIPDGVVQTGYVVEQSGELYNVILEPTAQTSTVTLDSGYADAEEVIIELPNQTIVSNGSNLVIPTLEDGFQNMTVEVDGKKFTTVVEVSNGVIVNDVDMTIPKGTSTVDSQKLETDTNLSKTVVANINTVFDDLSGENLEVEVSLSIPEKSSTDNIVAQSGGSACVSIEININTVTDNTTGSISETSGLLEFIIPIPEENLGMALQVYRDHNGEISALPQLSSRNNVTTEGFLVENGYIHIFAQKFSTYTAVTGAEAVEDDDDIIFPPWGWDDDDDYVPPIVPSQTEDSGDDNTTSIVACAAAAVVAALMAAYLIIDRRR